MACSVCLMPRKMYNNAGILDSPFARILDTKKSDLERVLSVNLVGSFLGAKHAARVMVPQCKGCILFTSSAATAISGLSSHAYTASKCGMCYDPEKVEGR
jgi:NAD(P)-dependent dehydrogenase (short-subunit alcohol dehydrogenase family)